MDFEIARRNMIECQVRTNRVVLPKLLDALAAVPRESFAPSAYRSVAYVDDDIPLGGGRVMIEPMALARLYQFAEISQDDLVLIVGAGAGYGAALASRMAQMVFALEADADLAAAARRTLGEIGVVNAVVVDGPLAEGYVKEAPYDVIVVEGAMETRPDGLTDQLAKGGRLVGVAMEPGGRTGRATKWTSSAGGVGQFSAFDVACPVLPGFERPQVFTL